MLRPTGNGRPRNSRVKYTAAGPTDSAAHVAASGRITCKDESVKSTREISPEAEEEVYVSARTPTFKTQRVIENFIAKHAVDARPAANWDGKDKEQFDMKAAMAMADELTKLNETPIPVSAKKEKGVVEQKKPVAQNKPSSKPVQQIHTQDSQPPTPADSKGKQKENVTVVYKENKDSDAGKQPVSTTTNRQTNASATAKDPEKHAVAGKASAGSNGNAASADITIGSTQLKKGQSTHTVTSSTSPPALSFITSTAVQHTGSSKVSTPTQAGASSQQGSQSLITPVQPTNLNHTASSSTQTATDIAGAASTANQTLKPESWPEKTRQPKTLGIALVQGSSPKTCTTRVSSTEKADQPDASVKTPVHKSHPQIGGSQRDEIGEKEVEESDEEPSLPTNSRRKRHQAQIEEKESGSKQQEQPAKVPPPTKLKHSPVSTPRPGGSVQDSPIQAAPSLSCTDQTPSTASVVHSRSVRKMTTSSKKLAAPAHASPVQAFHLARDSTAIPSGPSPSMSGSSSANFATPAAISSVSITQTHLSNPATGISSQIAPVSAPKTTQVASTLTQPQSSSLTETSVNQVLKMLKTFGFGLVDGPVTTAATTAHPHGNAPKGLNIFACKPLSKPKPVARNSSATPVHKQALTIFVKPAMFIAPGCSIAASQWAPPEIAVPADVSTSHSLLALQDAISFIDNEQRKKANAQCEVARRASVAKAAADLDVAMPDAKQPDPPGGEVNIEMLDVPEKNDEEMSDEVNIYSTQSAESTPEQEMSDVPIEEPGSDIVDVDMSLTETSTDGTADTELTDFEQQQETRSDVLMLENAPCSGADAAGLGLYDSSALPMGTTTSAVEISTLEPSVFQPSAFQPSNFQPSTFQPSAFQPSTFQPSTFQPSTFQPSTFQPSTLAQNAVAADPLYYQADRTTVELALVQGVQELPSLDQLPAQSNTGLTETSDVDGKSTDNSSVVSISTTEELLEPQVPQYIGRMHDEYLSSCTKDDWLIAMNLKECDWQDNVDNLEAQCSESDYEEACRAEPWKRYRWSRDPILPGTWGYTPLKQHEAAIRPNRDTILTIPKHADNLEEADLPCSGSDDLAAAATAATCPNTQADKDAADDFTMAGSYLEAVESDGDPSWSLRATGLLAAGVVTVGTMMAVWW